MYSKKLLKNPMHPTDPPHWTELAISLTPSRSNLPSPTKPVQNGPPKPVQNYGPQSRAKTMAPQSQSKTIALQSRSNYMSPQSRSKTMSPQSRSKTMAPQSRSNTMAPQSRYKTMAPQSRSKTMAPLVSVIWLSRLAVNGYTRKNHAAMLNVVTKGFAKSPSPHPHQPPYPPFLF